MKKLRAIIIIIGQGTRDTVRVDANASDIMSINRQIILVKATTWKNYCHLEFRCMSITKKIPDEFSKPAQSYDKSCR